MSFKAALIHTRLAAVHFTGAPKGDETWGFAMLPPRRLLGIASRRQLIVEDLVWTFEKTGRVLVKDVRLGVDKSPSSTTRQLVQLLL